MKLIKIKEDHYVVVDDSEIKEGDWIYNPDREPSLLQCIGKGSIRGWNKITHSTQPLGIGWQQEVIELSLQEVKELIGEVDVEKKAREEVERYTISTSSIDLKAKIQRFQGYMKGYNQALEDNKEKKYTEEDMRKAFEYGKTLDGYDWFGDLLESLQPKTEWEVCFVDGKLKLV